MSLSYQLFRTTLTNYSVLCQLSQLVKAFLSNELAKLSAANDRVAIKS